MAEVKTIDEWIAWRATERQKHRTMTWGEYRAWRQGGDAISSPGEGNAFPGGITILFGGPDIIGKSDPQA